MKIELNGEPRDVPEQATVASLLAELGVRGNVAVERNRRIVPRADHAQEKLHEGDRLEVVTFVGGG